MSIRTWPSSRQKFGASICGNETFEILVTRPPAGSAAIGLRAYRTGIGQRVITATHYIGQVRWLADHVVLFIHGEVKAHQNVAQLLDRSSVEEAGAFVRGEIVE